MKNLAALYKKSIPVEQSKILDNQTLLEEVFPQIKLQFIRYVDLAAD